METIEIRYNQKTVIYRKTTSVLSFMKSFFSLLLLFSAANCWAQVPFPKGFRLVKGEALSGKDDIYTNGRYTFQVSRTRWLDNDDDLRKNGAFLRTKDSLYWHTGKIEDLYFYEVYNGELITLWSAYNDQAFAGYSKWLLSTMRRYHHTATLLFPPR